jgi:hypothetical protein
MIIAVAIVCLFSGAAFGYFIADKASQHAIYAARAKGLIEGRSAGAWDHRDMQRELDRLRLRNRHLEAKERTLSTTRPST